MVRKSQGGEKTAAEFVQECMQDPEFMKKYRENQRKSQEALAMYMEAARPVYAELRDAGFDVNRNIRIDLLNGGRYEAAVPILMKWIPRVEYEPLKESMIRALAVPWAKGAVKGLLEEFTKAESDNIGWVIGNSIEVIATDAVFEDIVRLVEDKKYGIKRQMLVMGLRRMKKKKEDAIKVLLGLLKDDDDVIVRTALETMFKMKAKVPAEKVRPFLEHPERNVRRQAKKLLKYTV